MKNNKSVYIAPVSFLNDKNGQSLFKQGLARRLGEKKYFCEIKIYNRDSGYSYTMPVSQFEKKYLQKHMRLSSMYQNIISKKKLFVKNVDILKKNDYLIFGILNITPDSFSDGGKFNSANSGFAKANHMYNEGANFIDVGGESTRPGARKVPANQELIRVLPVLQKLCEKKIPISLDTRNSSTMHFSNFYDVAIINDVSALRDRESVNFLKSSKLPVILMHMPGNPKTMMNKKYKDVILDTYDFLEKRIKFCVKNGIQKNKIVIDPGIGFGKNKEQNIQLIKNISIFHSLGCAIMLGVSRKKIISSFGKKNLANERVGGSISIALNCFTKGVEIFRVHDVKETIQAIEAWKSIDN